MPAVRISDLNVDMMLLDTYMAADSDMVPKPKLRGSASQRRDFGKVPPYAASAHPPLRIHPARRFGSARCTAITVTTSK
jgi:hypothetical protein